MGRINKTYSTAEVKEYFAQYKCILLDEYKNAKVSMRYICSCGNEDASNTFAKFKNSKYKGCRRCAIKRKYGKEVRTKEFNKNDCIEIFWRHYHEYGTYPKWIDFENNADYPPTYHFRKHWGNFDNFLMNEVKVMGENGWYTHDEKVLLDMYEHEKDRSKILESLMVKRKWDMVINKASSMGLKRPNRIAKGKEVITEEYLIKKFWDYYREYDVYPLAKDFRNSDIYPHYSFYSKMFGSWHSFLKHVEVISRDNEDGWYVKDESILRRFYPVGDMESIKKLLIIKRDSAAIREKANSLGLKVKKEIRYQSKYKDETIKNQLIDIAKYIYKRYSIIPEVNDFYNYGYHDKIIEHNFTTFDKLLNACGIPVKFKVFELNEKKDGISCLKEVANELKRTPYIKDLEKYGVFGSWFVVKFGSYKNACLEAGLEPNSTFYSRNQLYYSLDGSTCRSLPEKIITDYLFLNNFNYKKECLYRNIVNDKKTVGMKRLDWLINEQVAVEYFGLMDKDWYRKTAKEKIDICKKERIKLIELYPEDLERSLKGVKQKLSPFQK